MDMKAQGSRNGKALGIGELLASACSTSALLDRSWICQKAWAGPSRRGITYRSAAVAN